MLLLLLGLACEPSKPSDSAADSSPGDTAPVVWPDDGDADGDGFAAEHDCDDADAGTHPLAEELPYDGRDNDCDPRTPDDDLDGDGAALGSDCDDADPLRHPDAAERCDEIDDDCDGEIDEEAPDAPLWYADGDGDGYGATDAPIQACAQPSGAVADASDCDDAQPAVHPAAEELCGNGVDDDCDGGANACSPGGSVGLFDVATCVIGDEEAAYLGTAVMGDVDLDQDGRADLAISAPYADRGVANEGELRVALGAALGGDLSTAPSLTLAAETSGNGDQAGVSLGRGDVDGDGFVDLLVGASVHSDLAATTGVVYAVTGPLSDDAGLAEVAGRLYGETGDQVGTYPPASGDLDGDGVDDVIVGAISSASNGYGGSATLWYGPITSALTHDDAAQVWNGSAPGNSTGQASLIADLDADGLGDVVIGSPGKYEVSGQPKGQVGVLFEPVLGTTAALTPDIEVVGANPGDYAGTELVAADLSGDGALDLLVTLPGDDAGGQDAGAVRLVVGPLGAADVDLADVSAMIYGDSAGADLGDALASPGDVDGDGFEDLLVGAPGEDGADSDAGAAYLFYGPIVAALDAREADATFTGDGEGQRAGFAVASGGDLDGDGGPDLLVGAPRAGSVTNGGAACLIPGGGM